MKPNGVILGKGRINVHRCRRCGHTYETT
jgi:hypothetical protein